MIFTAAVIGLGNIGLEYDFNDSTGDLTITHASGFRRHPGFELVAGVDPAPDRRARFEKKYGRPAYPSVEQLLCRFNPEIFSIGIPAARQPEIFHLVLSTGPKAVICEKPLAASLPEGQAMIDAAGAAGCPVLVNYIRRFDPGVNQLRSMMQQEGFSRPYKGAAWYSKGLRNNGSHFIDLLRYLLGEVRGVDVVSPGRLWGGVDPEPDLKLHFEGCEVILLSAREEHYSFGHIDLIFPEGMITCRDSGQVIEIRRASKDPVFHGYTALQTAPSIILKNDLNRYQWHVLEGLYAHLVMHSPLASDGANALKNLDIVETAISKRSPKADD